MGINYDRSFAVEISFKEYPVAVSLNFSVCLCSFKTKFRPQAVLRLTLNAEIVSGKLFCGNACAAGA